MHYIVEALFPEDPAPLVLSVSGIHDSDPN